MMKTNSKFLLFKMALMCLIVCAASNPYRAGRKVRVVVLNAGHGGTDPGCHGLKHLEKEVALSITLKVGKYIEDNLKDVKVVNRREGWSRNDIKFKARSGHVWNRTGRKGT